jgi:hypothetical protein
MNYFINNNFLNTNISQENYKITNNNNNINNIINNNEIKNKINEIKIVTEETKNILNNVVITIENQSEMLNNTYINTNKNKVLMNQSEYILKTMSWSGWFSLLFNNIFLRITNIYKYRNVKNNKIIDINNFESREKKDIVNNNNNNNNSINNNSIILDKEIIELNFLENSLNELININKYIGEHLTKQNELLNEIDSDTFSIDNKIKKNIENIKDLL